MKCISTPRSILKSIIGAIYASDFMDVIIRLISKVERLKNSILLNKR